MLKAPYPTTARGTTGGPSKADRPEGAAPSRPEPPPGPMGGGLRAGKGNGRNDHRQANEGGHR